MDYDGHNEVKKNKDKLYRILKQTCQNDESYNVLAFNLLYKNILNGAIRKAKRMYMLICLIYIKQT